MKLFFQSLKLKQLLLLIFLLFFIISLIDGVFSQDEPLIKVLEGEEEILVKFKKGDDPRKFELTLDEDSNQFDAYVKIQALSLWDRERSKVISGESIRFSLSDETDAKTGFLVSRSTSETISVTVDPENVEPGTYSGKIVISYGNASDNITSDIVIPLKIQLGDTVWLAFGLLFVGIMLGVIANFVGVKKSEGELSSNSYFTINGIKKNFWPFIAGVIVVIIILLTTLVLYYPRLVDFGADPLLDYIVTILFGFGEYGSGKVTTDTINKALGR